MVKSQSVSTTSGAVGRQRGAQGNGCVADGRELHY